MDLHAWIRGYKGSVPRSSTSLKQSPLTKSVVVSQGQPFCFAEQCPREGSATNFNFYGRRNPPSLRSGGSSVGRTLLCCALQESPFPFPCLT